MKIKFFDDDMSSDLDDFVEKHNVIDIKIIYDVYSTSDNDARHDKNKTNIRYLVMYDDKKTRRS